MKEVYFVRMVHVTDRLASRGAMQKKQTKEIRVETMSAESHTAKDLELWHSDGTELIIF